MIDAGETLSACPERRNLQCQHIPHALNRRDRFVFGSGESLAPRRKSRRLTKQSGSEIISRIPRMNSLIAQCAVRLIYLDGSSSVEKQKHSSGVARKESNALVCRELSLAPGHAEDVRQNGGPRISQFGRGHLIPRVAGAGGLQVHGQRRPD